MTENPLHEAAEAITHAFGIAHKDLAITLVYHDLVEALVHPHNAEAIDHIRGHAATHRRYGAAAEGLVAILGKDLDMVLAHLGIEPKDYDREVAPGVDRIESTITAAIEKELAEEMLKQAPADSRPN